jgi:hypothetical protein
MTDGRNIGLQKMAKTKPVEAPYLKTIDELFGVSPGYCNTVDNRKTDIVILNHDRVGLIV